MVNAAKALAEVDKDDRMKESEKEQSEQQEFHEVVTPTTGRGRPKRANAGKKKILDE